MHSGVELVTLELSASLAGERNEEINLSNYMKIGNFGLLAVLFS